MKYMEKCLEWGIYLLPCYYYSALKGRGLVEKLISSRYIINLSKRINISVLGSRSLKKN